MINMEVNGTTIQVKLYENSSAESVKELLKKGPFTIEMKDYAHMEKFGSFGMQFPTNDETITTEAGDVILSEGNLLVIYYAPNTWKFYEAWKDPESVRDRIETGTWKRKYYGSPDAGGRRITKRERFCGLSLFNTWLFNVVSAFFIHVLLSHEAFLQSSDHRGLRFRCVRYPVLRFRSYLLR